MSIETDKEQLKKLWKSYRKDHFTYTKYPNINISPEVHKKYTKSFAKILLKENNPIELD